MYPQGEKYRVLGVDILRARAKRCIFCSFVEASRPSSNTPQASRDSKDYRISIPVFSQLPPCLSLWIDRTSQYTMYNAEDRFFRAENDWEFFNCPWYCNFIFKDGCTTKAAFCSSHEFQVYQNIRVEGISNFSSDWFDDDSRVQEFNMRCTPLENSDDPATVPPADTSRGSKKNKTKGTRSTLKIPDVSHHLSDKEQSPRKRFRPGQKKQGEDGYVLSPRASMSSDNDNSRGVKRIELQLRLENRLQIFNFDVKSIIEYGSAGKGPSPPML